MKIFDMNISTNFTDSTNLTLYELCEIEHDIGSIDELITCYLYLFKYSIAESLLGLVVVLGTCIANTLVIVLIILTHKKITLFDQILIGHGKNLSFLFLI